MAHSTLLSRDRSACSLIHSSAGRWAALLLLAFFCFGLQSCRKKTEEELLTEAAQQMKERNLLGATLLYQDFIKKYPNSPNAAVARLHLAECYYADKDYDKSRQVLDEVIKASGGADSVRGLNALDLKIQTLVAQDRVVEALNEAVRTSDTLRTVDQEYKDFFTMRVALLMLMNKKRDEALTIYQSIVNRPKVKVEYHAEAVRRMASVYLNEVKDVDKAAQIYLDYFAKYPDTELNGPFYFDLANIYLQAKQKEKSDGFFDQGEAVLRKQIEAAVGADEKSLLMFQLAEILQQRGKPEDARATYQKVIDDFPMGNYRGRAMLLMSQNFYINGDIETSLKSLEDIMQKYPKSPDAAAAYRMAQQIRVARNQASATTGTLKTATPEAPLAAETAAEPQAAPTVEATAAAEPTVEAATPEPTATPAKKKASTKKAGAGAEKKSKSQSKKQQ